MTPPSIRSAVLSWHVVVGWKGLMTVGFRLLFSNAGLLLDDAVQSKQSRRLRSQMASLFLVW